jgi:putative cell wall-binding protein
MKKLISLFLALMMAILAIPALAEDAQDPDMAFDPDIDPDFLVGAGLAESHPHDISITKEAPNYSRNS